MLSSPEYSMVDKTLNTAVGTTPEIDWRGATKATIHIPTGSSITSLTYHSAAKPGGTFRPLYKEDATTAVTQTVAAARSYDVPAACFGAGALKIVVNVAGAVEISIKG